MSIAAMHPRPAAVCSWRCKLARAGPGMNKRRAGPGCATDAEARQGDAGRRAAAKRWPVINAAQNRTIRLSVGFFYILRKPRTSDVSMYLILYVQNFLV